MEGIHVSYAPTETTILGFMVASTMLFTTN